MEEKVIYIEKKQKLQFSKVVTFVILAIITITWGIGLFLYWDNVDLFNYLLDYVSSVGLGVMPYFCLSAMDRINYIMQAKYKERGKD